MKATNALLLLTVSMAVMVTNAADEDDAKPDTDSKYEDQISTPAAVTYGGGKDDAKPDTDTKPVDRKATPAICKKEKEACDLKKRECCQVKGQPRLGCLNSVDGVPKCYKLINDSRKP